MKDEAQKVESDKNSIKGDDKVVDQVETKAEDGSGNQKVEKTKKKEYKKEPMLKQFKKDSSFKSSGVVIGAFLVVLLGVGSGWFLSGTSSAEEAAPKAEVIEEDNGKSVGIPIQNGEEEFDEAEGILEEGGIDGEGTHHLVREGGESKYVYLTSTTLDLQSFVGKTVLVKGETMAAQSAPWLMDVWVIKEIE